MAASPPAPMPNESRSKAASRKTTRPTEEKNTWRGSEDYYKQHVVRKIGLTTLPPRSCQVASIRRWTPMAPPPAIASRGVREVGMEESSSLAN